MQKVKSNIIHFALAFAVMLTAGLIIAPSTYADDCVDGTMSIGNGVNCAKGADTPDSLFGNEGIFSTIVNVILFIVGALSVVMIIYGGIRYTISAGDSSKVTSAKNTIMYAIVGLIVSILAFAIVNFVVGSID